MQTLTFRRTLSPASQKVSAARVPQVVCGDFNIDRYAQEVDYRSMLQTLDARNRDRTKIDYSYDRQNNDLHVEPSVRRDLIDYILIRSNFAWVDSVESKVHIFQHRWNPLHQDLSDHYSLEAEVRFKNLPVTEVAFIPAELH